MSKDTTQNILSIAEKWFTVKINLIWFFGILIFSLTALFILSYTWLKCILWIREAIGFIGGIASLFGIFIAIIQLIATKKDVEYAVLISESAKNASEETQNSIKKTISIIQLAKYCEYIKLIQEHLMNSELKMVIHLTQELQDAIIDIRNYLKYQGMSFDEESLTSHIKKMGINIRFLRTAISRKSEKYKREEISKDFDELLNIMLTLKSQLKDYNK